MTMEYKGYLAGPIDFDPEDGGFSGTVHGLRDVLYFEGRDAAELLASFRGTIDEYLAVCAQEGRAPDKPYSGQIGLRTAPDLHRKAALRADAEGTSINQWISRLIEQA